MTLLNWTEQTERNDAVSRRSLLKLMGLGGASMIAMSAMGRQTFAAPSEIVYANFGGEAVTGADIAYGQPFTKKTGIPVRIDGASPLPGKITAMVEGGTVTWDVVEADAFSADQLGEAGLLEPVDFTRVDKSDLPEGYDAKWGVPNYSYSLAMLYDSTVFPDAPPTLADFFDTATYPGGRTLWKYMCGATEACLLAAGVAKEDVYKLSAEEYVAKALEKLSTIRDDVIYWDSAADSVQMFLNEEVIMGIVFSGRASTIARASNDRFKLTWVDALNCASALVVPKGAPAGAEAFDLISEILQPESQIAALREMGFGVVNPKAIPLVPDDLKPWDPRQPENLAVQLVRDEDWYAANFEVAIVKWIEGISS